MENTLLPSDTAALCVDGRASWDQAGRGLVAQELIEGLANHVFAEEGPLVLAHPQQDLTSPFRRANTKRPSAGSWLTPLWEKKFLAARQVGWFHRFVPLDKINLSTGCSVITTVLPPLKKLPFYVSRRNGHQFVVPSRADADWLEKQYAIPSKQVSVISPSPRRAVVSLPQLSFSGERGIVVVRDGWKDGFDPFISVIRRAFPQMRLATINLRDAEAVDPERWTRTLQNTSVCFYLVRAPFDWATLALEAMYWNVPTFYADGNRALSELLPHSRLALHSFLAETPAISELAALASEGREKLEAAGVFDPEPQAMAYRNLYSRLGALG